MAYSQLTCQFILNTDASLVAIGAVLSQVQDEVERVVAYGSKVLGKAERNYCTMDRELLTIKHFLEHYKQYLLGRPFLVRTDHQALRYLFSLKEPKDRTTRWIKIMSTYDFAIEYRPGKKHGNAFGMSRCPIPMSCKCPEVSELIDLKCGPCKKYVRRAEVMSSDLRPQSNLDEGVKDGCPTIRTTRQGSARSWCDAMSQKQLRKAQLEDKDLSSVIRWLESQESGHQGMR